MMKTFRLLLPLLLVLPACQRQDPVPASEPEQQALVEHILYAAVPGEEVPELKTLIDPEDANSTKVLWSAGEEISILSGGANYCFTGTNTREAAVAAFSGNAPEELDSYIALYPYDASAAILDGKVSTTLGAVQRAKAGTFADGCLVTADDAVGTTIAFKHLCSGLRFQVGRGDITSVSLRGNGGEKIAGDFQFHFATADKPEVGAGTEEVITLNAPSTYFETGVWYYIILLPTTFPDGFTLTANVDGQVGEFSLGREVVFSPGGFKNITGMLNERMTWTNVCYGPENSFCLRPGTSLTIDVAPRKIIGAWQRSAIAAFDPVPDHCAVLWGNASASLSGTTLTITAASEGSSLVAIQKGSTILWSYLIWVTAAAPAELTLPGGGKLLPPLGGTLFFQWGRKDPLQSDCDRVANLGVGGLDYSITHPQVFIKGTYDATDWFCQGKSTQDATLWGADGSKTVWDPCPEGYRVPSEADFTHIDFDFNYLVDHFEELGYLHNDVYYPTFRSYWTRTPAGSFATALDDGSNPVVFYGQSRNIASPVRCIKE